MQIRAFNYLVNHLSSNPGSKKVKFGYDNNYAPENWQQNTSSQYSQNPQNGPYSQFQSPNNSQQNGPANMYSNYNNLNSPPKTNPNSNYPGQNQNYYSGGQGPMHYGNY